MTSDYLHAVNQLSKEALSLLLVLRAMAEGKEHRKKTNAEELARLANIGIFRIDEYLSELLAKGFVQQSEKASGFRLIVDETEFLYEPKNTEEKRLLALEQENLELTKRLAESESSSGLTTILTGDYRMVVLEMEQHFGRALLSAEAFFVGIALNSWGAKRVLTAFRQCKDQRKPIQGMFAMMHNGKFGKGRTAKEESDGGPSYQRVGDIRDI